MIDDISNIRLLMAASLILINGLLSVLLQLGMGWQLLLATVRMIVQLVIVGWVLTELFRLVSPSLTLLAAIIMLLFAAYEVRARQKKRFSGGWGYSMGLGSMLISAFVITTIALTLFLNGEPWYHPRYALPLLGMILGNTMTGVTLGLSTLTSNAHKEYAGIEAQLALGANMRQAMKPVTKEALRTGMIPILNAMAATGVVSLPGMMTGQILAGVEPSVAVRYQILIMFLIAGATGLGVLLAVLAGVYRLTDDRQRLRLDRLSD